MKSYTCTQSLVSHPIARAPSAGHLTQTTSKTKTQKHKYMIFKFFLEEPGGLQSKGSQRVRHDEWTERATQQLILEPLLHSIF